MTNLHTMHYSFSLLFWLYKYKINKSGEAPFYARVTVNNKRAEIATGEKISPERWNTNAGSVKGNWEDTRRINNTLDRISLKIRGIYHDLFFENLIINHLNGKLRNLRLH